MGVKIDKLLEKLFILEHKITELSENFLNYLENESYYIKLNSDMIDCEDYILIKIEIPGIDKDDLNIYKKENNLIVKGNKKKEYNEENVRFLLAERRFGIFYNIYPIPEEFDIDSVEIKIKNGLMTLKIPRKSTTTVIKKIEIE